MLFFYVYCNWSKRNLHAGCGHELCVRCALYLCSTANVSSEMQGPPGSIPCPLCRHGIISFVKLPGSQAKENKLHASLSLCTPCIQHPRRDLDPQSHTPEIRRNRVASVSSEMLCPVTCTPFPSVAIPLCTCNDGPCPSCEPRDIETQDESPRHSQETDQDKMEGTRLGKTTCSNMFWGRRSCSREHQCNSEINAWLNRKVCGHSHFVDTVYSLISSLKLWHPVDVIYMKKKASFYAAVLLHKLRARR